MSQPTLSGPVITKRVTLDASGQAIVTFDSPRRTFNPLNGVAVTPIQAIARQVQLTTANASVTVSTDGGVNNQPVPVPAATGSEPLLLTGIIHSLLIKGANTNTIDIVATLAS